MPAAAAALFRLASMEASSVRRAAWCLGTALAKHRPRPNLFLVGAMKSGTTWLSQLLAAHPAVFISSPKEPTHFVDPQVLRRVWPYMWRQGYCSSEQRYLDLFATAGNATILAEASTAYSQVPIYGGVPQRILAFNPQARFLYIMRDPVERTVSHYWHRVRAAREHRPMLAAIRSEPQYTDVSHYARQLGEYLQHVRRERIYVLTLEELLADPPGQLQQLHRWLGIDPHVQVPQLPASNTRPETLEQVRGFGILDRFRHISRYRRAAPYVPRVLRELGVRLAVRSVRPAEVDDRAARDYLRSLQRPQTEELGRLLGRAFPDWTTLYAAPTGPRRPHAGRVPAVSTAGLWQR